MKKSELKDKIKEMVLAEVELDIEDSAKENSLYDFMNEADEEEAAAEETTDIETPEGDAEVDTTVDVSTDEVDPNVKSVQDALTQAQAAAQQLGDKKLMDQIGNTITFFTRTHVVEKPGLAEGMPINEGGASLEDIHDYFEIMIANQPDDVLNLIMDLITSEGRNFDQWMSNIADDVMDTLLAYPSIDEGPEYVPGSNKDIDDKSASMAIGMMTKESKKSHYKGAVKDDEDHIKALKKDIKADKKKLQENKEPIFPMWNKLNK
jgi:hypothetical protein